MEWSLNHQVMTHYTFSPSNTYMYAHMHSHSCSSAVMSGEEGGDWFLVERYESDIEEEGGASASSHTPKKAVKGEKQLMLVISERFLEERSSMGDKVKVYF